MTTKVYITQLCPIVFIHSLWVCMGYICDFIHYQLCTINTKNDTEQQKVHVIQELYKYYHKECGKYN